jgi:hypothetical protein
VAKEDDGGLRVIFRDHLPEFHWQSVETGGTGQGVPDANYCADGCEGWVEYKWTDGWACTLKPEQIGWHDRRARAGGITWIAVRRRTAGGPRTAAAIQAKEQGLRGPGGLTWHVWTGGPSAWPWGVIGALLRTRGGHVPGPKAARAAKPAPKAPKNRSVVSPRGVPGRL